jgi:hypothetical protein
MPATLDGIAPFELVTPANVAAGSATLYLGPVGTAMPADTVNMGVSWAVSVAAWVPQGGSQSGWIFNWTPTTTDLPIDESPIPAGVLVNSVDANITGTLAEDTIQNVLTSMGCGSLVTQAAGASGVVGKSTWSGSTILNPMALGVEGATPAGHWRRISIPRVVSVGTVAVGFNRATSQRMYACTFRAICLPSQIQWTDKTAESTS